VIIEVKGVQFVNKGAELMLESIAQKLKKDLNINYNIALNPRNSPFQERVKYGAYQKIGSLFKRIDWSYFDFAIPNIICNNYGLVKHNNVDITLDASGFAYGQQWNPAMLKHSVRQAKLMKKQGGKYIFMPQAMGPFESTAYKKLIQDAVSNCTLMYVRDKKSYKYVTEIVGVSGKVILSPDFTNIIDLGSASLPTCISGKFITIIPNNKMLSSQNSSNINSKKYISELISAAKLLQNSSYKVVILNHEGPKDLDLCKSVYSQLDPQNTILLDGLSTLEIKKVIGESEFVICSRFHGCVSALSQGVPVVGTSWSHKYEMLFDDYNVSNLLYKFEEPLVNFIRHKLGLISELTSTISLSAKIEKEKTEIMWENIIRHIEKK
jgi:colanic acid/amylovoran biosynthesis protein